MEFFYENIVAKKMFDWYVNTPLCSGQLYYYNTIIIEVMNNLNIWLKQSG